MAAFALTLSATALNTLPIVGTAFSLVLPFVVAYVAGATIVVALKVLFQTDRRKYLLTTQYAKAGGKSLPAFLYPTSLRSDGTRLDLPAIALVSQRVLRAPLGG